MNELDVPPDGLVVISAERLSGHTSTGGYDTFRIARRIGATVPEATVFFAVREQIAMIESEYRQLVLEGTPARLADLVARPSNWVVPGFDLAHYCYDLLADEYVRTFGPSRVHVFSFEEIVADPGRYLHDLATRLEIDPWPPLGAAVLATRVNRGLSPRLLDLRRRLNHFQRSALNPEPVMALRPVWRRPLSAVAARLPRRTRPLLDAATRDHLRAYYRDSNERLGRRYGVVL